MAQGNDVRLKVFAAHWLNGPLPADLMADLATIMGDDDYVPEKRVHQIVWQALKYGMNGDFQTHHPNTKGTPND